MCRLRVLIAFLISVAGAGMASAQSCSCTTVTPDDLIAKADFAFVGVALGTMHVDDGFIHREGDGPWLTRFEVLEPRKGSYAESTTLVRHDMDDDFCGATFPVGETFLVAGNRNPKNQPTTNACMVVPLPDKK
jgi:hypothetical protein